MKRLWVALALLAAVGILSLGTSALAGKMDALYRSLEKYGFAPVPKTGETYDNPQAPGNDGELQMGIPWPEPRFTDNGDGTVTDNLTGLIWMKNALDPVNDGQKNWYEACAACRALADDGATLTDGSQPGDWRLPNVRELLSLVDYGESGLALPQGHPFVNEDNTFYWSSTTHTYSSGVNARYMDFWFGDELNVTKGEVNFNVRCVRDAK